MTDGRTAPAKCCTEEQMARMDLEASAREKIDAKSRGHILRGVELQSARRTEGLPPTPVEHTIGFLNQLLVVEYGHSKADADTVNEDRKVCRARTRITQQGAARDAGLDVHQWARCGHGRRAELLATVFAAWNDLLIDRRSPSDDDIIREAYAWHESKQHFEPDRITESICWLKKHDFAPTSIGPRTVLATQGDLLVTGEGT
jgi:hypothetical protein